jgi:hypothetical protein
MLFYTDWIENYLTKEHFIFVKNLNLLRWQMVYNRRKLGMDLVREKHTTKNRSEQFNIIINQLISKLGNIQSNLFNNFI